MAPGFKRLRDSPEVARSVSRAMKGNRANGTKPEVMLREALWRSGSRGYRKNYRPLPGFPDLAFLRAKVCVFVHGCFWHGCERCSLAPPRKNPTYWREKLLHNKERDLANAEALVERGFRVLVVWECEVRKDPDAVVGRIGELVGKRL